jgi:hypothetical protein
MTVVVPPAAAARVVAVIPSSTHDRVCTCASTNPGSTNDPMASTLAVPERGVSDVAVMSPSVTPSQPDRRTEPSGSTISPRTTRSWVERPFIDSAS